MNRNRRWLMFALSAGLSATLWTGCSGFTGKSRPARVNSAGMPIAKKPANQPVLAAQPKPESAVVNPSYSQQLNAPANGVAATPTESKPAYDPGPKTMRQRMASIIPHRQSSSTPPSPAVNDPTRLATSPGPVNADLYVQAARVSERSGSASLAIQQYRKALEIDPRGVSAMIGLARLHDRQGEWNEAVDLYRQAIQTNPNFAIAHNDLALCMARKGDLAQAELGLLEALRLEPQSKLYRNNMATVLLEMRRPDEALQHLTAAHPEPIAYFNLGYLLQQRGQRDESAAAFRRAVELDPSFVPARQMLERLQQRAAVEESETPAASTARRLPVWDDLGRL